MKRRRFLLAAGTLAAPWAVLAQQVSRKLHRLGFLGSGSASGMAKPVEALKSGLRDLGYVEGKNIAIEYRWGEGRFERLPDLATDLLRQKVELVVAWGTPATAALKRATSTVPIVMVNVGDPDATGLIASLARPGGNITGVANLGGNVTAKQVELLTQVIPGITRIAVLRNPVNPSLVPQLNGAETAARSLGLQLNVLDVRAPKDFDAAFAAMLEARAAGVLVLADPLFFDQAGLIAELANKSRLPTVSARSETADAGILMTYGASTIEQFRTGAMYVDKILRGAKPADLPVEQAAKFDLVFNLKTAKSIGIAISDSLRVRADRVIE